MNQITSFSSGMLFGLGLIISEMVNPARVQGFLDWFGNWDPTLAFVMAGALSVTVPAFYYLKRRNKPVLAENFQWPQKHDLDSRLITGAILFGAGWGMAGLCPGPAITALATLSADVWIFVVAMMAGMGLFSLWDRPGGL